MGKDAGYCGYLDAKRRPMRAHENICVFYKKQPTYNFQKTFGHKRKVSLAVHKQNTKKTRQKYTTKPINVITILLKDTQAAFYYLNQINKSVLYIQLKSQLP